MTHGRQMIVVNAVQRGTRPVRVSKAPTYKAFYASTGRRGRRHVSTRQRQLLLEVGIENFDVQERGFRDGHSFRPYAQ